MTREIQLFISLLLGINREGSIDAEKKRTKRKGDLVANKRIYITLRPTLFHLGKGQTSAVLLAEADKGASIQVHLTISLLGLTHQAIPIASCKISAFVILPCNHLPT